MTEYFNFIVNLDALQQWEFLSYVATVVGIPMAIILWAVEQRKERANEHEETYREYTNDYKDILQILIDNPEIDHHDQPITHDDKKEEKQLLQKQRRFYETLISVFESAFIVLYGDRDDKYQRMWNSWEDYIKEWLAKNNFRQELPRLLQGEDAEFCQYVGDLHRKMYGVDLPAYQELPSATHDIGGPL